MTSITRVDRESYESGYSKLEQLEALLLLASSEGIDALSRMVKPAQMNLAALAYDLALDARTSFADIRNPKDLS